MLYVLRIDFHLLLKNKITSYFMVLQVGDVKYNQM